METFLTKEHRTLQAGLRRIGKKECLDCGNIYFLDRFVKRWHGKIGPRCKPCFNNSNREKQRLYLEGRRRLKGPRKLLLRDYDSWVGRKFTTARKGAKERGATITLTLQEFFGICESLDYKCGYGCGCDDKDILVVEHIRPISLGGEHSKKNVTLACPNCNAKKGVKETMDLNGQLRIA